MELILGTELSTIRNDVDFDRPLTRLTPNSVPEHDDPPVVSLGKPPGFDVDLRPLHPVVSDLRSDLSLS